MVTDLDEPEDGLLTGEGVAGDGPEGDDGVDGVDGVYPLWTYTVTQNDKFDIDKMLRFEWFKWFVISDQIIMKQIKMGFHSGTTHKLYSTDPPKFEPKSHVASAAVDPIHPSQLTLSPLSLVICTEIGAVRGGPPEQIKNESPLFLVYDVLHDEQLMEILKVFEVHFYMSSSLSHYIVIKLTKLQNSCTHRISKMQNVFIFDST